MDEAKSLKKMKPILKLVNSHVETNALLTVHVEKVKTEVKNASKQWLKGGSQNPMSGIHITKLHITNSEHIWITLPYQKNKIGRNRPYS